MRDKIPTFLQKQIIESSGKTVLKSCPGSGKTFVVATKMINEVYDWKYKNKGIALLSFTNVANNEINKQIKAISGINKISYPHYTGTIDSFISQFLFLPYGHLIMRCSDRPSIIQDYSLNIKEYSDRIWKAQCHQNRCDPLDFYIDINGDVNNIKKDVSNCLIDKRKPCISLKNYCYKHGYATYADVITIAIRILESYPDIGKLLARKFPSIIIDEAQDTSAYQMRIIELLESYGVSNILIIGDPDQAIYEWRNADPSVFLNKYNNAEWNPRELNENFRCSQNICNATKVFSTLSCVSSATGKSAKSDFKPQILKYNADDKTEIIEYFLEICGQRGIEITPDQVAVLVRGRSGLIGKDYSQINNLWQSQTAKLLSEAAYERDYKSIGRAATLVSKALFQVFINSSLVSNDIDFEAIEKIMTRNQWRKIVFKFCRSMPCADMPLGLWKKQITRFILQFKVEYNLEILVGSEIKIKTRDTKLKDFLEQPIKNFYAKSIVDNYLNSTIHAVKGCTFEAVLLLIGKNGKLTSNMLNTKPIESEEIRTAYVAMTRATQVLIVAIPDSIKKKSLVRFSTTDWDLKL
ncbi:ATP-dependent helicase [Clostridium algidicarnis]|uniref:ATP-dependent helicase n=1 Tax=Clostridium algidicarnis TaxID=37659 RepID=UPI001C0BEDC9|nr:ATP-dependent helicase [Clostridium algidicarnis]MBU3203521.1 ATP-dependent helicase [Clostridium algidicarnis]MBU3211675.1 ATP-dependent helicase [Clostridium algidicarnis]MBU3221817.1 ATP-dependent helicase [Clostridium algidicarnis]